MDNKVLRTEYKTQSCVIVAERDGVLKYVSKKFPNLFQYTIKLSDAKQFMDAYKAYEFIEAYKYKNSKFEIINPQVATVEHSHKLKHIEVKGANK